MERPEIHARMVAGLRNVDEDLARTVAGGLGLDDLPEPLPAARPPVTDLAPSPALSILANGPESFAGRKIGVLVTDGTDGTDADLLGEIRQAAGKEQVNVEVVAPAVGGITDSAGQRVPADQKLDGAPSVLYEAVVLLPSADGAATLSRQPAARDFVTDAYAHCKFIGHGPDAAALFAATGLEAQIDDGFIALADGATTEEFIGRCAELRFWDREAALG